MKTRVFIMCNYEVRKYSIFHNYLAHKYSVEINLSVLVFYGYMLKVCSHKNAQKSCKSVTRNVTKHLTYVHFHCYYSRVPYLTAKDTAFMIWTKTLPSFKATWKFLHALFFLG